MKKFLSVSLIFVLMMTLLLTACGKKEVKAINITEGFKYEYEIGETPDFSSVKATVVYNDDTTKEVAGADLTFGKLDTSTAGKKDLEVSYGGFTTTYQVTVKNKSIATKELTSIEYLSGIPANVYAGDTVHFENVSIILNYSDGSKETKTISENANIKHNGAEIDTKVAGKKTLKITFMGKSLEVVIDVKEVVVTKLEIESADSTIVDGTQFNPEGMKVYAVFNNGNRILVNVSDLTINQDDDKVTITYNGVSAELLLNVEAPVVTGMTLNTSTFTDTVLTGDSVSTSGIVATGTLNNGLSKNIPASELSFSAIDTSVAGVYTITATYTVDPAITATFTLNVLGIKSVEIIASSIKTLIPAGTTLNTANLQILITAEDDSRHTRDMADGITVNLDNLNAEDINEESYITVTFRGFTSASLKIAVHDPDINYAIYDVDLPKSITDFEDKRALFLNTSNGYNVGDDNPFILKLSLTILNNENKLVEGFTEYNSYFEIYIVENGVRTLLEGDALAAYVEEINASGNSVDFTQAAVGKTFVIKTRPADGIDDSEIENMTRELTVEVVDGINIYEAWELNYLTNYDDPDYKEISERFYPTAANHNQTSVVDAFLLTKGATRPATMAGAVLHNDLTVKRTDIPAEYFVGADRNNDLFEWITVFSHATDDTNKTFTFYGNHYTIFSYQLPNVCAPGVGNQNDYTSSGQLFRFTSMYARDLFAQGAEVAKNFNLEDYVTNIKNLHLKDDNPNKDEAATADRDMRGLIGMKVQWQIINAENVILESFYISYFADNDYTIMNINECKFFNSYQNHIYSYNKNPVSGDDSAPNDNYSPIIINITNSEITKCGGPVILNQIEGPQRNNNAKTGPQITIDEKTEIWTWVTGQEAWFKATGSGPYATQLAQLGLLLAQNNMPKTFVSTKGEGGLTDASGVHFMNMIMVTIVSGSDPEEIFKSTADLDCKLDIAGSTYLNMNDEASMNGYGYGDINVTTNFLQQAAAGKNPIIVNTRSGGTLVVDDGQVNGVQVSAPSASVVAKPECLADGDYVSIYYGTFGFVFGYAPYN